MLSQQLSDLAANVETDYVCRLLNSGSLCIYDGVQPETADDELDGQTLLAELFFQQPAFRSAMAGVAVANAIEPETQAKGSGKATWFRALTSEGSAVFDGSVGVEAANLVLATVMIEAGDRVEIGEFTFTSRKN